MNTLMMPINSRYTLFLAVLMLATRLHFNDTSAFTPDASLAVFFLVGYSCSRRAFLPGFLLLAVLTDYLAITVGGISEYCWTPAYTFLVPAYGVVWMAGRYCRSQGLTWADPLLAVLFWSGSSVAFLISELSFYQFSGYVQQDILAYATSMIQYYPSYIVPGVIYVLAILAMARLPGIHTGRRFSESA